MPLIYHARFLKVSSFWAFTMSNETLGKFAAAVGAYPLFKSRENKKHGK